MPPEQKYSPSGGEVVEPTEARQASPRKDNFRVLLASMTLAVVVGVVLIMGFWRTTPTSMDYSSGGKLGEQGPTPAAQPGTSTPAVPLPQATPATPTPPPTPPTTP